MTEFHGKRNGRPEMEAEVDDEELEDLEEELEDDAVFDDIGAADEMLDFEEEPGKDAVDMEEVALMVDMEDRPSAVVVGTEAIARKIFNLCLCCCHYS